MQNVLVAAEAASQHNRVNLKLLGSDGGPLPLDAGETLNPFVFLGIPERFYGIDDNLAAVTRECARALHPDRFVHVNPDWQLRASQRMSAVTHAARSLRSLSDRRGVIFKNHGITLGKPAGIFTWAERWFDLQDSLDAAAVARFGTELQAETDRLEGIRMGLEKQWDATPELGLLQEIADITALVQTFDSLKADISRKLEKQ